MSGVKTEDEGLFVVQHGYWQEAMQQASPSRPKAQLSRATARSSDGHRNAPDVRRAASRIDTRSSSSSTARRATSTTASSTSGWSATRPTAEFWMPAWDDDDTLDHRPADARSR